MGVREYNLVVNWLKSARTFGDLERAITRMGFDMGEPNEAAEKIETFRNHVTHRQEQGLTEYEAVREAADYLLSRVFSLRMVDGEHRGIR